MLCVIKCYEIGIILTYVLLRTHFYVTVINVTYELDCSVINTAKHITPSIDNDKQ